MSEIAEAASLLVSFPAAGAGGSTLEQLAKFAARRGMAYLALPNPPSIDALGSGSWQAGAVEELRLAAAEAGARHILMVGHCMGGLSAVRLAADLDANFTVPVAMVVINTPCPDPAGRIPTMSRLSDAEIAAVLAHEGFPQELLDDEDMLAEVAEGLRDEATVADRLAELVSGAEALDDLYVLATRGDMFISPERCVGWRDRVSGEFHLIIADGGHALDDSSAGLIDRVLDAALAGARAGPV